jgi:hypothetical protein
MGWFVDEDLVPVELECRCPDTPHEKDTVYLYPQLTVEGGLAGEQYWAEITTGGVPNAEAMIGHLGRLFLHHGIASWTFVGADGEPLPASMRNIVRFAQNWSAAKPVAEKANELYSEALLAPLVASLSKSSRRGPTGGSTSPKPASSSKPRKPSRRSTTATTRPRLSVIPTSDGDSSSSPKRKSASA